MYCMCVYVCMYVYEYFVPVSAMEIRVEHDDGVRQ